MMSFFSKWRWFITWTFLVVDVIFVTADNKTGPVSSYKSNLVWSGFTISGSTPSHDFHLCEYGGKDAFCYYTGYQSLGYARGHGMIMDLSFKALTSVQSQGGLVPNDQHEFNVINGGKSALLTVYQPTVYDMTAYGASGGQGSIMDNFAQEVDTTTGKVIWQWSALEHVDPSLSYVPANSTQVAGDGLTIATPWDYFHINSVDKDKNGDYLISSRHTSCIYKVSGENGTIIWRLGGMLSSFVVAGFNFSYQHDARFVSENASTVVISFFDNNSDGFTFNSPYSTGLVVKLDKANMVATKIREYKPPNDLIAESQGNTQLLPDGNVFMGWGSNAWVSEYTEDGDMVFAATFASTGALHYRAYKFNVTTEPTDAPATFVYAHNTSAPTTYYMSWNGATKPVQWRIYTSSDPNKEFKLLATTPKNGFETIFKSDFYQAWSIVEAVDANGKGLANSSSYVSTFVPSTGLAESCNEEQCPMATGYSHKPTVLAQQEGSGSPTISTIPTPSRTITAAASSSTSSAASSSSVTSSAAPAQSSNSQKGTGHALTKSEGSEERWALIGVAGVAFAWMLWM